MKVRTPCFFKYSRYKVITMAKSSDSKVGLLKWFSVKQNFTSASPVFEAAINIFHYTRAIELFGRWIMLPLVS